MGASVILKGFLFYVFRFPEAIRHDETGVPYTTIDWMEFYRLRRKGVRPLVGASRLLTDLEARDTGLLACEYFTLFTS